MAVPSSPPRLNSSSAASAVQRLATQMTAAISEAGTVATLRPLISDLAALGVALTSDTFVVDVAIGGDVSMEQANTALAWLTGAAESRLDSLDDLPREWHSSPAPRRTLHLRAIHLEKPSPRRATEMPAALLCVIGAAAGAASAAALATNRPLTILIAPESSDQSLRRAVASQSWVVENLALERLPAQTLPARLSGSAWSELAMLCRAQSALRALIAAGEVARLALEEEGRALRGRKAVAQQRATTVQRAPSNPVELMGELRVIAQRYLTEFERGSKDRLARFHSPNTGALWPDIERHLRGLQRLDRGGPSGESEVHIPADFERTFIAWLRRSLESHLASDISALHEQIALLCADTDRALAQAGFPPVLSAMRPLGGEALPQLLAPRLRIDRPYRGEIPLAGMDEYLAIIRRNYIVVSLGTTLVGMLGLRTVLSSPKTVLLVVPLLPVGAWLIHRTVKHSRRELLTKELEKARDTLRVETRRILTEIERAWEAMLSEFVRDALTSHLAQLDVTVRAAAARRLEELGEEKRQVQRQLASLELPDRQLQIANKARTVAATTSAQFFGELRQLFQALRERLEAEAR